MSSEGRSRKRFTVDALFEDTRPQAAGTRDLADARLIDLARIHPDPAQPRRTFDPDRMEELAASIRIDGVLQPIAVRFDQENDRYVILHGERRWRAAKQAGLTAIPALVRDVPVERRLAQQLTENVQREDLNAVDRAAALRALRSQLGDPPWETVADAVGIKRSRLFQLLGTGKLAPEAQEDIRSGRLSEKQSRALQGLTGAKQEALRALIVADNIPAPAALRLARAWRDEPDIEGSDVETARQRLGELRDFVFGANVTQVARQTSALLAAIRAAASGADRERMALERLASTLDSGRFATDRFERDVNNLARSLSALPPDQVSTAQDRLAELRDTIALLLATEPE
ncbi:MAG TPA: ParB/RepB/Spo0J family partition protein [Thermomicrobiales bacterium]|nr:ParB/RepB/Spo0J family partition protein [Thermomicrobiales bacterium]